VEEIRLALLQSNLFLGRPDSNIAHLSSLVKKAMEQSPDVIILPEMWNASYDLGKLKESADRDGCPSASQMSSLACKYGVNIIAGSISDFRNDKFYNTSYVFNRQGDLIARYDKIHLFGLMNEERYLSPGEERAVFKLDGVKCGLIICYDLRFPELIRALALDGIDILFVPAQWPHPRMHPWRTLLQARAIENQMYVAAVNRVGQEGKAAFFGHSMVVDPLGEIILEGDEEESILVTELDLERILKVREYMTCFNDRRPETYF
jgi:omega-amidase